MERIVRGRSATLSHTFYSGGAATNPTPDTATVTVVRLSDGSTVTTGSVDNSGVGVATVTIPASSNTLLDTYTMTWTATFGGESQTFVDTVEVAGGTLFTLADARALSPLSDTNAYTDADIVATRTTVEQAVEQACARAFVPRYERETLTGPCGREILLKRPLVTSIRSVTIDGTALTVGELAELSFTPAGVVYRSSGWSSGWMRGVGNIVVGYEHGSQDAPHEIRRAALMLAKMWLVGQRSPIDDRAVTFSTNDAGSYSLAVPGRNGSHFGAPDVDAAIDRYSLSVGIA